MPAAGSRKEKIKKRSPTVSSNYTYVLFTPCSSSHVSKKQSWTVVSEMPKTAEEVSSPNKKNVKRKFDSLETFVRTLSTNRHPTLRLNPDAAKLMARMAEDSLDRLAEGGINLMRWKNKRAVTLKSKDIKTFIETSYPEALSEAMLARCRVAERQFSRAKKQKATT